MWGIGKEKGKVNVGKKTLWTLMHDAHAYATHAPSGRGAHNTACQQAAESQLHSPYSPRYCLPRREPGRMLCRQGERGRRGWAGIRGWAGVKGGRFWKGDFLPDIIRTCAMHVNQECAEQRARPESTKTTLGPTHVVAGLLGIDALVLGAFGQDALLDHGGGGLHQHGVQGLLGVLGLGGVDHAAGCGGRRVVAEVSKKKWMGGRK